MAVLGCEREEPASPLSPGPPCSPSVDLHVHGGDHSPSCVVQVVQQGGVVHEEWPGGLLKAGDVCRLTRQS